MRDEDVRMAVDLDLGDVDGEGDGLVGVQTAFVADPADCAAEVPGEEADRRDCETTRSSRGDDRSGVGIGAGDDSIGGKRLRLAPGASALDGHSDVATAEDAATTPRYSRAAASRAAADVG